MAAGIPSSHRCVGLEVVPPARLAIAPTTRDGATRDEDGGFRVLVLDGYSHLDPVSSEAAEPVASIVAFIDEHQQGTVTTPP